MWLLMLEDTEETFEMRIWRILTSIAALAIGLALWQSGRLESEGCCGGDGTVQGLVELFFDVLSLPFFAASVIVLIRGDRILPIIGNHLAGRSEWDGEGLRAEKVPGPGPHPRHRDERRPETGGGR